MMGMAFTGTVKCRGLKLGILLVLNFLKTIKNQFIIIPPPKGKIKINAFFFLMPLCLQVRASKMLFPCCSSSPFLPPPSPLIFQDTKETEWEEH